MRALEMIEKPILAPPENREEYFRELYEATFPRVASIVSKFGGSFQDAKDVFHDSLIIFYERITFDSAQIKVSPEAYIPGIAKHLCIKKFNQDKRQLLFEAWEAGITIPEDIEEISNTEDKILRLLERAGKRCMALLKAFYYDNLKITDLARAFGFSSEHSASVQKFKCLEKVRDVVKQKSLTYEDLK